MFSSEYSQNFPSTFERLLLTFNAYLIKDLVFQGVKYFFASYFRKTLKSPSVLTSAKSDVYNTVVFVATRSRS